MSVTVCEVMKEVMANGVGIRGSTGGRGDRVNMTIKLIGIGVRIPFRFLSEVDNWEGYYFIGYGATDM